MSALPYYFVRRLPTGRWAVAHRVPGANVDAVDTDCGTLKAAWSLACEMNEQREVGWQIKNVFASTT
jgi:hypothetical protein